MTQTTPGEDETTPDTLESEPATPDTCIFKNSGQFGNSEIGTNFTAAAIIQGLDEKEIVRMDRLSLCGNSDNSRFVGLSYRLSTTHFKTNEFTEGWRTTPIGDATNCTELVIDEANGEFISNVTIYADTTELTAIIANTNLGQSLSVGTPDLLMQSIT